MITVSVERSTQAAPKPLIDRIWLGAEWRSIRSGVKGLAVEYDDGRHQSVHVCMDSRPSYLAMTVNRFRDSGSRISFFYSRLPRGVVRQTGLWEARATDRGCRLRLLRRLELQRAQGESDASFREREDIHTDLLKQHLSLILDVVAQSEATGS